MDPRRSDQLAAMVGIHGLAHPARRAGGAQLVEDSIVVQDRFHHDIVAHDGGCTRAPVADRLVGTGSRSWVKKGRRPILARAKWATQVNPAGVKPAPFLGG